MAEFFSCNANGITLAHLGVSRDALGIATAFLGTADGNPILSYSTAYDSASSLWLALPR
jgi:hypothetical protein